jgi:hypothetical protein
MKRVMTLLAWLVGILVVSAAALVALMVLRFGVTRPTLYELQSGYRGWLHLRYEDPSCSPPSSSGLFQVIRVDTNGRGCTSSALPKGWHYQRAEYLNTDGSRSAAPPVWPLGHSEQQKLVIVFVGPEDEFRASPGPPLR